MFYRRLSRSVLFAVFITLLAVGLPVHAKPEALVTLGYHTVQPGETLYCIGRAYGVSPWAIATYNGIANPNVVYPGWVLAIPAAYAALPAGPTCARQFPAFGPGTCACAAHHTVVTGENLYRISLHYGVSMWRIAECNGIVNLNYIRVGQVLCIPAS
jgi:LysM repeat protein